MGIAGNSLVYNESESRAPKVLFDMRVDDLNKFINEREAVRIKKESGAPRPWSEDTILQQWKFCNVHREDDRTTRWIAKNWREPNAQDPDLWYALVIARRALNWPGSMEALGYPVPWNPDKFLQVLHARSASGAKSYDTAYQLLVQGRKGDKAENLIRYVLAPLWEARDFIRPRKGDTLRSFFDRLSGFKYMGLFYSGQVVADLKYAQLQDAPDWESFAVPGPGSERGLNRVMDRPFKNVWRKGEWDVMFQTLRSHITHPMHGQDLQNCLCEWDKYERIRLGDGRVRPYHPTKEPLP